MITIIAIVTLVIAMAVVDSLIPRIVEAQIVRAAKEKEAVYLSLEDKCRCKACVKRIVAENKAAEKAMYMDALNNPDAFFAEVCLSNGADGMAPVWARATINEARRANN